MNYFAITTLVLHTLIEGLFGIYLLIDPVGATPQEGQIALNWMRNYAAAAIAIAAITLSALIKYKNQLDFTSNVGLIVFHAIVSCLVIYKYSIGHSSLLVVCIHSYFFIAFSLMMKITVRSTCDKTN